MLLGVCAVLLGICAIRNLCCLCCKEFLVLGVCAVRSLCF